MIALLGLLPEDLRNAWPRYRKYFDDQDVQTTFEVDCVPSLGSLDDLAEDGDLDTDKADVMEDNHNNVDEGTHYSHWNTSPRHTNEVFTQEHYPSLIEVYQRPSSEKTHPSLGQITDTTNGPTSPPLRDRWLQDKHPGIASEESEAVADLLYKIVRYEPAERLTAREILRHPRITRFCI